ncbi:hypothetical protein ABEG18_14620 [Alsobacter sp. KACC 23698]|uniref:Uncharacterized protein n=1 Tax=Alsobacter sp. KACC 23698 TaxID=3149229 RepID=A0AAU7J9W4_9HYPH
MADLDKLEAAIRRMDPLERGDFLAITLARLEAKPEASYVLNRIERVWRDEAYFLPPGFDRERPDPGLLKCLGYRVGRTQGQPAQIRIMIIFFLLSAETLPPVKDALYMGEWGDAWSRKRLDKFVRVQKRLIEEAAEDYRQDLAIAEREEDIKVARWAWEQYNEKGIGGV